MGGVCELVSEILSVEKVSQAMKKPPTELTVRGFFCELPVS
jgi:hypothetical protein